MTLRGRRACSPSAARNRGPILEVLGRQLRPGMRVLELASGSGEHAVHLARGIGGLSWQPSDVDDEALASIEAWRAATPDAGIQPPIRLDAAGAEWPGPALRPLDAIVCINLVHIAPPEVAEGVLGGAARGLVADGILYLYGPFTRGGLHTAPSNEAFDRQLRARDPRWGVRDADALGARAAELGLRLAEIVPMPANNFSLVFRREGGGEPGQPGNASS